MAYMGGKAYYSKPDRDGILLYKNWVTMKNLGIYISLVMLILTISTGAVGYGQLKEKTGNNEATLKEFKEESKEKEEAIQDFMTSQMVLNERVKRLKDEARTPNTP
jgi:hypothetical protein